MANAWVEVPVSTKDGFVHTLLDVDDYIRLGGRRLSLGSHGYAQMWHEKTVKVVHRWVLCLEKNRRIVADHINHETLDNRRCNLRALTPSESNMNRRVRPVNADFGVVRLPSGKWAARVKWLRRVTQIGTFPSEEAAASAVRAWRQRTRPEVEALRPRAVSS